MQRQGGPQGQIYVNSKNLDAVWIVSVIDTITNKVITTTSVDTGPGFVATTARNVYVANSNAQTVSVIDL